VAFLSSTTAIIARTSLAPAPAPPPNVQPLRDSGAPATQWRTAPRTVPQLLNNAVRIPTGGGGNNGLAVVLPDQGPPPGVGGPVSPSAAAPTLASLGETPRLLLKVVPFVAAIFFWQKGDHVLAGVSAAAGALAVVSL
jgi:hypothetical protein